MDKVVLGVSDVDRDAGVALAIDGKVVAAANEERFSQSTSWFSLPVP